MQVWVARSIYRSHLATGRPSLDSTEYCIKQSIYMGKHVELFSCYIILKAVMTQTDWNRSTERQEAFTLRLYGCWWPGDTRTRAISSHGIVLFLLKYPILCHSRTIFGGRFFFLFFFYFFFADVWTEFHEIFKIGRTCYKEQLVTFGGSSGAPSHNYSGFFKVCEQHLRE